MTSLTDCQTRNGSAYGRVFATSERRFVTNPTMNRMKNGCECLFHPISIDRTREASSLRVLRLERIVRVGLTITVAAAFLG